MGEPVERDVKSSVLDTLSAGCKLHFQTLRVKHGGSIRSGEGGFELFLWDLWLTDGTGSVQPPLGADGFQNSGLFQV